MSRAGEQTALEQIRKYLDAGHSVDAIRDAGWGEWIDHFDAKGVSLADAPLDPVPPNTQPPVEEQADDAGPSVLGNSPRSWALGRTSRLKRWRACATT